MWRQADVTPLPQSFNPISVLCCLLWTVSPCDLELSISSCSSQIHVGPSCVSYLARHRRHHALHPTRHPGIGSQQDLEQMGEWNSVSHLICHVHQFYVAFTGLCHLCCC